MAGTGSDLPAAGNRNGTNLNNAGSNGNYWSSSLNTDNPNNAWNVNFNSDNANRNNNNRYNGQSVRPVTVFMMNRNSTPIFDTSPQQLLQDLYRAWKDARRHKRSRDYQLRFERNLEGELIRLRDVILSGRYRPGPSTCFIIHDPKMREVFAAQFRDRVVHHLLYNYIAPLLIPGFIRDSYSCIPGRGTHDGILRLEGSIRIVSCNFTRPCFVLKLDVEGYFMHINRERLLEICLSALEPFREHLDFPLVKFLLEVIIRDDPTVNSRRRGSPDDWKGLPDSKSLFHSPPGCGLPISNLTSQLFSNIYMDLFDKYMVSLAGEGRYGRYVDDAYVVGMSPEQLRRVIPLSKAFLRDRLGLRLSRNKIAIYSAYRGVEFLGAYIKPFRRYVGNSCLKRMERKMASWTSHPPDHLEQSVNSYLGITSHYRAYNIRLRWMSDFFCLYMQGGYFCRGLLKYRLSKSTAQKTDLLNTCLRSRGSPIKLGMTDRPALGLKKEVRGSDPRVPASALRAG